ncbi:hypothetical protein M1D96_11845 [Pseudomonas sp. D1-3]
MEIFNLAICIFGAPTLSLIILSAIVGGTNKKTKYNLKEIFTLNAEKGLAEQPPLWLGLLTPFFYALITGMYTWHPFAIEISAAGFKNFISISALPIALLSLTIPIAVLVSRLHATQQTALQINTSKVKNNLDNFYSHRKNLFEYFDRVGTVHYSPTFSGAFKAHPRLHKNAFKGSSPENGTPQICSDFFQSAEENLNSIRSFTYAQLSEEDPYKKIAYLQNASAALWRLSYMLLLPEIYEGLYSKSFVFKESISTNSKSAYMIFPGNTTADLVFAYRYELAFFRNLCEFSGYDSPFLKKVDGDKSETTSLEHGRRFEEAEKLSIAKMAEQLKPHFVYGTT